MKLSNIKDFVFGTLRGRLILGVALVHAVMMTLFIIDLTIRQRKILLDRQVDEATALAQSLSTSAAVWIASNDVSGLQELVESQRRYPELAFAMLTDDSGLVLAHTDHTKHGQYLLDLPSQTDKPVVIKSEKMIEVLAPAQLENRQIGWASVSISRLAAEKKLAKITFSGILYALAAIVIGSFIAWLMGLWFTQRLYAVQNTISEVRKGNSKSRSKIKGADEAASIATEFNILLDSLDTQHSLLFALINSSTEFVIFSLDKNFCYTAFNEKHRIEMKKIWNVEIEVGMNLLECMTITPLKELAKQSMDRVLNGEAFTEVQHQPGPDIYYELNWNPIYQNKEVVGITTFVRNITQHKRSEIQILKLNRIYSVLSNINQAIVRLREPEKIMNEACRIAVEHGKFNMAWIGIKNTKTNKVEVVASSGNTGDYLDKINIDLSDDERNCGPTGIAVLTGQHKIVNNIVLDDSMISWRSDALKYGYNSSASFPLIVNEKVIGTFNLYSDENGFFQEDDIKLLDEMAIDISFALEFIESETERELVEKSLKESEEKFRTLIQKIQAAVVVHGADSRIITCNAKAQELLGLTEDQLMGKTSIDPAWHFYSEDMKVLPFEEYPVNKVIISQQELRNYIVGVHRPNSENDIWVLVNADPVFDKNEELFQVIVTFIDISDRKQTEKALFEGQQVFRTLVENSPDIIARYDRNCKRTYVNPVYLNEAHIPQQELLSTTPLQRSPLPEASALILQNLLKKVLESGIADSADVLWPKGDGIDHWYNVYASPEFDRDGKVMSVMTISRDITMRKQAEQERQANLHYFESIDMINRVMQKADNLEQMMSNVLDTMLTIFGCDRAFLATPCDPSMPEFKISMERTSPLYPGAFARGMTVPMSPAVKHLFQELLSNPAPNEIYVGNGLDPDDIVWKTFEIKSQLSIALYPMVGKPWECGMHQCSYNRAWTPQEKQLFIEISRRLGDGLTSLLINRNMQESERRYRMVFENSPVSIWEEDFSDVKELFDNLKREGVTDLEYYFNEHPEILQQCAGLIKIVDVNLSALAMHQAATKQELMANLANTFTIESFDALRHEFIRLWKGDTEMVTDAIVKTLKGYLRNVTVYVAVCPGHEETLSKILVSLVDITERKKAENALIKSEASLNEAQRIGELGSWELDLVSNHLSWSDEIYRIFEIDPNEFGASYEAFLDTIHPDDREKVDFAYTNSLKTRMPYSIDHRLLFSDGRIKYVQEQCETFYDEKGNPLRSIGVVQNITKRKLVEDALFFIAQRSWQTSSENFFEALAQFLGEKLDMDYVLIDKIDENPDMAETVAMYANGSITPNLRYSLKGTPCENVMGRQLCVYLSGIQQLFPEDTLLPAMGAESYIGIPLWNSTGRPIGLIAVMGNKPLSDETPVTQLLQLVAIRAAAELERWQTEEEIKKLNQELEQRVKQRTIQLELANKELEAFAYSVSHDLRAPLRGIDGFSQVLLEEYQDKIDDQGKNYLQRVRLAAQRMAQLIDDMLNLSRVSRTEINTQQVHLSEIAKEIAYNLLDNQSERKVEFVIQEGITVQGDERLLRIVLENLMRNAWKFTSNHPTARIEFGVLLQNEKQVYFVRDDGAGFDINYAQNLFGAFQRLHTTNEFPGTGIGLATVQRVIHKHGGKVWAEGEVEKGATFYFTVA